LEQASEQLARDRLDQLELEKLARRQEELAKRAAQLVVPKGDPKAQAELDAVRTKQQRLLDEMDRLAKKRPLLREARTAGQNQPAEQLAKKAMRLAQARRERGKKSQSMPAKQRLEQQREEIDQTQQLVKELMDLAERSKSDKAHALAKEAQA